MTAINCYRMADRIVIHSDAAMYDPTGIFLGATTKTFTFLGKRMAVAIRGPSFFAAHIAASLSGLFPDIAAARSGHSLLKVMVPLLKRQAEGMAPGYSDFQAVMAGWTESGPDSFVITSEEAPFALVDLPALATAPIPTAPMVGVDEENFQPEAHGLAVLQAQRRSTFDNVLLVGGHALSTTLWPDRIEQRVFHHWGDTPGQFIRIAAND